MIDMPLHRSLLMGSAQIAVMKSMGYRHGLTPLPRAHKKGRRQETFR
jgi:hypothetical protein